jgi:hypothetical protein
LGGGGEQHSVAGLTRPDRDTDRQDASMSVKPPFGR